MPYFQVRLEGSGVSVPVEGEADPIIGFFTTRVVRADDEERALALAREVVLADWRGGGEFAQQNQGTLPVLSADDPVSHLGFLRGLFGRRRTGYAFYRYNE